MVSACGVIQSRFASAYRVRRAPLSRCLLGPHYACRRRCTSTAHRTSTTQHAQGSSLVASAQRKVRIQFHYLYPQTYHMWLACFKIRRNCCEDLTSCRQQVSLAVVRFQGRSFFGREAECEALQNYLQKPPATILVLLGPRNSGKTAVLQKVLRNSSSESDFPPCYLDLRSRQLTEPSVLVGLAQDYAVTALQRMSGFLRGFADSRVGKVFTALSASEKMTADDFSIPGEMVVAAFLLKQSQSIDSVFEVYDEMLNLYKSGKAPGGSWPVICIDEANVLTEWQHGSLERREALSALLRFFVKVCKPTDKYDVLHS